MEPMPRGLRILNLVTGGLFVIALYMVFFYAPLEAVMGEVQRVFYFHVAAGWVGAPAFLAQYSSDLRVAQERVPQIKFHSMREHSSRVFGSVG